MRYSLKALFLAAWLSGGLSAAEPQADPWKDVREAFSLGRPIPEAAFKGNELEFYKRLKKLAEGCPAGCVSEKPALRRKAVDGYMRALERACKVLKVEDAEAVKAVYCPPGEACRLSPAAVAKSGKPQGQGGGQGGKEALAGKAAEDLLKRAEDMAQGLEADKTDDLAGPEPELEVEKLNARNPAAGGDKTFFTPAPAAKAEEPAPAVDLPGLPSFVDRAVGGLVQDIREEFAAARLAKTRKLAAEALALLERADGDPAAAETLKQALLLPVPEEAAAKVRALLSAADRLFEAAFEAKLAARFTETRAAVCRKAHKRAKAVSKCESKAATEEELAAARDAVFTEDPELGLYMLARADYQSLVIEGLADGTLAKGSRLEPWEVGQGALPEGSFVVVDAEAAAGEEAEGEYSGLRFTKPDGATLFQGSRTRGDKTDELVLSVDADGLVERVARTTKPGKRGKPPAVVRYEATTRDAQGRKVRWEKLEKGVTEVKEFNKNAKDDGDYWRYEKVYTKKKKVYREIQDFNAGTITTLAGDAFTVKTSGKKGLPLDAKAKDAPPEQRWKAQKGVIKDGKPLVTELQLADGRTIRGRTDPDTGAFTTTDELQADGSGIRMSGKVIVILGPGGKVQGYQMSLDGVPEKPDMQDAWDVVREYGPAAGMSSKRHDSFAGWLFDQMKKGLTDCRLVAEDGSEEIAYVCGETIRSTGVWTLGTEFKGSEPGLVLRDINSRNVPEREYLTHQIKREWVKAYSSSGSDGYIYSDLKHTKHSLLVEYRRGELSWDDDPAKWVTRCKIYTKRVKHPKQIDLPCADADSKASVVTHTGSSGLSSFVGALSKGLNDLPGMAHVSKGATKVFYNAVGQLQDNIGFNTSGNANKQIGWIANTLRGCMSGKAACEREAEERIVNNAEIPDLLERLDETIYEELKKDSNYLDTCARLADECDTWIRGMEITWELRFQFLRDAFSPQQAAAKGGAVAAVLGNVAIMGEQTFASLPIAFFGQGLGALGNVKHVGGAARLGGAAMSTYFVATSAVDGTSNALAFVQAAGVGNYRAAASALVQAGLDFTYSRLGARDALRQHAKLQEKALVKERARLEELAVQKIAERKAAKIETVVAAAPVQAPRFSFGRLFGRVLPKKATAAEIQDRAMRAAQEEIANGEPAGTRAAGVLSSDAVEIQRHKDCGVRAIFNLPELAPAREAFFNQYDRFLVVAEKIAGERLRDNGTNGLHTRIILESLGYEAQWRTIPDDADALAARVHENAGALWANIDILAKGKPKTQKGKRSSKTPSHSVSLSGAFKENGSWIFVIVDSNYKQPQLYTYDQLKALDLVTLGVKRGINPQTKLPLTDAELTARAAEVSNERLSQAAPQPAGFLGRLVSNILGPRGPPESGVTVKETGADGTAKTVVEGAGGGAAPASRFISKKEAHVRFGGQDPLKAESTSLGGVGGGGARRVQINGEAWVIKSRRAGDKSALANNRIRAQNEMLGRELVRRFFPEFDTPEGLAYQDGDWTVVMSRYEPGRNKDIEPGKSTTPEEKAALSVLHEVFGVGDMNYGNILFGGPKPLLIDFEAIGRTSPIDSAKFAALIIRNGWAPFVSRTAYNDPAPYAAAHEKWKQRFADPAFLKDFKAGMKEAGLSPKESAAYLELVEKNLRSYEANIGHYLDAANSRVAKSQTVGVQ